MSGGIKGVHGKFTAWFHKTHTQFHIFTIRISLDNLILIKLDIYKSAKIELITIFLFNLSKLYAEMCLFSNDIRDYNYVAQGKTEIPGVDDKEEARLTDVRTCQKALVSPFRLRLN